MKTAIFFLLFSVLIVAIAAGKTSQKTVIEVEQTPEKVKEDKLKKVSTRKVFALYCSQKRLPSFASIPCRKVASKKNMNWREFYSTVVKPQNLNQALRNFCGKKKGTDYANTMYVLQA